MKIIALSVVIIGMILGCQNLASQSQERNGDEKAMTARNAPTSKIMQPPIDLSAVARTETATFALG